MSHKSHQRPKLRPDKTRPTVQQHQTSARAAKVIAPPSIADPTEAISEATTDAHAAPASGPPPPVAAPATNGTHATNTELAPLSAPSQVTPPATPRAVPPHDAPPAAAKSATATEKPPLPAPKPPGAAFPVETNGTKHITQRTPTPPGELSEMFETLRALFVRDRANGARPDAARCGICYLTYTRDELIYHEEAGFYACTDCQHALETGAITMLRRQRR